MLSWRRKLSSSTECRASPTPILHTSSNHHCSRWPPHALPRCLRCWVPLTPPLSPPRTALASSFTLMQTRSTPNARKCATPHSSPTPSVRVANVHRPAICTNSGTRRHPKVPHRHMQLRCPPVWHYQAHGHRRGKEKVPPPRAVLGGGPDPVQARLPAHPLGAAAVR